MKKKTQRLTAMVLLLLCLTGWLLPGCAPKDSGGQPETSQETQKETVEETTGAPTTQPALSSESTEPSSPVQEETAPKATKAEDSSQQEGESKATAPKETKPQATEPPATQAPTDPPLKCTLNIRCDTLLDENNMAALLAQDSSKGAYVPSNGWILSTEISFTEGESVFSVLERACRQYGISLAASYTSQYDSSYVEGINHLYEFDCGSESGWMYQVNGTFPDYGCSKYILHNGDVIQWRYTCNGYGADLGAGGM